MQLNNTLNHKIIVIETIRDNIICYEYENDLRNNGSSLIFSNEIDKFQQVDANLTFAENEKILAYNFIAEKFADYELAEGKNWKFADNTIRLIVDKKKLTPHLLANDAVGQLVSYVLADANIKQHTIDQPTEEFIYIYLSFLLPEHEAVIAASDCIVIDYIDDTLIAEGNVTEV